MLGSYLEEPNQVSLRLFAKMTLASLRARPLLDATLALLAVAISTTGAAIAETPKIERPGFPLAPNRVITTKTLSATAPGGTVTTQSLTATAPGGAVNTTALTVIAPGGIVATQPLMVTAPGGTLTTQTLKAVAPGGTITTQPISAIAPPPKR
jgi:hypothetical protein